MTKEARFIKEKLISIPIKHYSRSWTAPAHEAMGQNAVEVVAMKD